MRKRVTVFAVGMSLLLAATLASAQTATPPRYQVLIGSLRAFNGVAHGNDTDYVTLAVEGPGQAPFVKTAGPHDLVGGNDDTRNFHDFGQELNTVVTVPNDPHAQLKISWNVVNAGTPEGQKIVNSAADIALKSLIPIPGLPIGAKDLPGLNLILTNCDEFLFGQTIILDGAALAKGLSGTAVASPTNNAPDGWMPTDHKGAHLGWFTVFDYPNIGSPCDIGHYNLVVVIRNKGF